MEADMLGRDLVTTLLLAIIIAVVLIVLPGCTTLDNLIGPTVSRGVKNYCDQVTPDARAVIRADINKAAAPNAVRVCCASDTGGIAGCIAP
jgi:hypothetical protein